MTYAASWKTGRQNPMSNDEHQTETTDELSTRWKLTWGVLPVVGGVSLAVTLAVADDPATDPWVFASTLVYLAGFGVIVLQPATHSPMTDPDDRQTETTIHVFRWHPRYGGGIKFVRAGSADEAWDNVVGYSGWRETVDDDGEIIAEKRYTYLGTVDEWQTDLSDRLDEHNVVAYGYEE